MASHPAFQVCDGGCSGLHSQAHSCSPPVPLLHPVLHQDSLLHSGLSPLNRLRAPLECGDWKQTEYSRHSLTSAEEKELFTALGHTGESTASVTFTMNSISRPKWFTERSFTVSCFTRNGQRKLHSWSLKLLLLLYLWD